MSEIRASKNTLYKYERIKRELIQNEFFNTHTLHTNLPHTNLLHEELQKKFQDHLFKWFFFAHFCVAKMRKNIVGWDFIPTDF